MRKIYAQYWGGLTLGSDVAEEIIGFSGNDLIRAGGGDDIIHAGKGNDVIEGGAGADQIDGGDGSDWVSYESAPAEFGRYGVTVDLEQGSGGNSDAAGDTYQSIENVAGSRFEDWIVGNWQDNILNGMGGNDVIMGGYGRDTMDGGEGVDTVSYIQDFIPNYRDAGVTVSLLLETATDAVGDSDVVKNFENVDATNKRDFITGNSKDNIIRTFDGGDTINAGGGADTIVAGKGNDVIKAGTGRDTIIGGEDADTMTGDDFGSVHEDTFFFDLRTGGERPGQDIITDFQVGIDTLKFDVNVVAQGRSQLVFTQEGDDTVITYANGSGSVTLQDVDVGLLNWSDIEFV